MRKKTLPKIILIISLLILVALIVIYVIQVKNSKPEVISARERYQQELLEKK